MLCRGKQFHPLNFSKTAFNDNSDKKFNRIVRKRPKQGRNEEFQDKFYGIDPWHINSQQKKRSDMSFKKLQSYMAKQKQVSINKKKERNFNFQNLQQSQFKNLFIENIVDGQINSPTKFDMMECSFRFQMYEHQKAQQIKNIIMTDRVRQTQKQINQNCTNERKTKNFIQRNIQSAFQLYDKTYPQLMRSKTLNQKITCQETKQQLLLNNQKLKKSSKQLKKFISMKYPNHKLKHHSENSKKYYYKLPIDSVWNLCYIQNSPNPEYKKYKKSRFKMEKFLNRGKSQDNKKCAWMKSDEPLHRNQQSEAKNLNENDTVQQNQRQLSRKLSRLYKVKKKVTLMIDNELINKNERKEAIKSHKQKFQSSRIHSLTPKRTNHILEPSFPFKRLQKDRTFHSWKNQAYSPGKRKQSRQRSMSANILTKTSISTSPLKSSTDKKTKPHQTIQQFSYQQSLYINGKECEIGQFFIE